MPVDIEAALREGFDRTVARNGVVFAGILFVIAVLNGLVSVGFVREATPPGMPGPFGGMPNAPAVGLSGPTAGVLWLVLAVASLVVTVGAIRTFVTAETERVPSGHFTRNIVLAAINLVVGGIVFGITVAIGFLLLVVPGFFLLVSLFFWNVYVVVEDDNFVAGFSRSWGLTRGHRWRLFALGIAVAVITVVVNAVFALPGVFLPAVAAFVLAQIGSAFVTVFTLATVSRTYRQLVALEGEAGAPADEAATV